MPEIRDDWYRDLEYGLLFRTMERVCGTISDCGSLPYQDCTDDNTGGYGDGIGTATVTSNPAWLMTVSNSVAAFNTQDGFDLLHLQGGGSSLTITRSLAYSNMGQQLKVGAASTARGIFLWETATL